MIGATYRIQFREGIGFDDAARLAPQLARAGISHLYASPIFEAASGSTHGYDVADHNVLDPVLGGAEAFDRMSAAMAAEGIKILLDIVPNHMAASSDNGWWRDVLTNGAASAHANHFDIDWTAPKLILPLLGKPYGTALADGDIVFAEHPQWGRVLRIPGSDLPLAPGTEAIDDVHTCHEAQNYRLAHWRIGRDGLSYRRFFEITGLVGVRVEDPAVFADVHALTLKLVADGKVHALRVDHVDGLADPAGYLEQLAEAAGVPILVEKILEPGEKLPQWPVLGTTGYEFIAAMASLFCDPDGIDSLSARYGALASDDIAALTRAAKHEIINRNLAGELLRLTDLALTLFKADTVKRDHGPFTVREGLSALLAGMPVYRTYVTEAAASEADRTVLAHAVEAARSDGLEDDAILGDLASLLAAPSPHESQRQFTVRFQQTSGPLMAKAVEDTLFYRHHRHLGLNEVGGSATPAFGTAPFLTVAAESGLAATQTHDTKRGEDARARLYALTEPAAAERFAAFWPTLPGDIADRLKWALGQMLFASAPLGSDPDFVDRFREAAIKTVREAKEETSWTAQDAAFEASIADAAERMARETHRLEAFDDVHRAGAVIGLGQALLKTFGRPAPDIYQGTFGWDFSMVDPDNRRPVDFAAEAALSEQAAAMTPEALLADWRSGAAKARVLTEGLAARNARLEFFAKSAVEEIPVADAAYRAFVRDDGRDLALAVVPVRPLSRLLGKGIALARPKLGLERLNRPLTARFTGAEIADSADAEAQLAEFPVLFATSW
ncbi:malto-oligosyltrehalose synthase [Acuticoccus sp. MNP-M23]|uniref:malto-oligosyltrehalose synthase n=1 Tax=Acuticoccus sp. MNP-M23 TaxID=3072793 RepID=UPI0028152BBB|nr:malto-oligosyltrehalose synthase [Acuticoccus sp. MNP-M23]WMS40802.1 malto-oligosyltrehalose synthase [Acuticoccus sp. MNP-M23]